MLKETDFFNSVCLCVQNGKGRFSRQDSAEFAGVDIAGPAFRAGFVAVVMSKADNVIPAAGDDGPGDIVIMDDRYPLALQGKVREIRGKVDVGELLSTKRHEVGIPVIVAQNDVNVL